MEKLKLFVINLSESDVVYFAGSNVNGNVLLELSEPKKTKGISIVLSGKACVHWTEENRMGGGMSGNRTVHYDDTEIIFNDMLIQFVGEWQGITIGSWEVRIPIQLSASI